MLTYGTIVGLKLWAIKARVRALLCVGFSISIRLQDSIWSIQHWKGSTNTWLSKSMNHKTLIQYNLNFIQSSIKAETYNCITLQPLHLQTAVVCVNYKTYLTVLSSINQVIWIPEGQLDCWTQLEDILPLVWKASSVFTVCILNQDVSGRSI